MTALPLHSGHGGVAFTWPAFAAALALWLVVGGLLYWRYRG